MCFLRGHTFNKTPYNINIYKTRELGEVYVIRDVLHSILCRKYINPSMFK